MIRCQQKYCKNCVKPTFDLSKNFIWGYCKISRHLVLLSDQEETSKYDIQPLYCQEYQPRTRKIKY